MNTKRNLKIVVTMMMFVVILLTNNVSPAFAAAPSNDNFSNATVITYTPFIDTVDTTEATLEPGEPQACGWGFERTVWYTFTPAAQGLYRIDVSGGDYLTLAVYSGSEFSNLQSIGCNYSSHPQLTSTLLAGTTYYIQAFKSFYVGSLTISISYIPPASNDDFVTASVISGVPYLNSVDMTDATLEPDEPWACGWNQQRTIWYSFTPVTSGGYTLESTGDYPTLAVYTGTDLNNLTNIGCSTDWTVHLMLTLDAGTTYYIQAFNNSYGTIIDIRVRPSTPPENDNFNSARAISVIPYTDAVDTTDATTEPGEPEFVCGDVVQRSVWYTFTPTESDFYTAESTGGYYPVLALYSGPNLADLQILDCKTDAYTARSILWLEVGTTYYYQSFIRYAGWGWNSSFTIYTTQHPEAGFYYSPLDPSVREPVQFNNNSWDPAGIGIQSCAWDFGDGNSASDCYPAHGFTVQGDYTVQLTVTTYDGRSGSTTQIIHIQDLSPANDNFTGAKVIQVIPYSDAEETAHATTEPGEPTGCGWNFHKTIWYAYTPATSTSYTAEANGGGYTTVAVYQGTDFTNLVQLACSTDWTARITIALEAGKTYYFQTHINGEWYGTQLNFNLYVAPPVEAGFYASISDPSKFDSVQFYEASYDPVGVGVATCSWNFGDSSTAVDCYPVHTYTADGDYTVQLSVTTFDGRTASTTQVVQVRTHDVGVTRFVLPNSARVGQTKQINVYIKNLYYPETVRVDLYKVTANGDEWVGSLNQSMPVRPANRAQLFTFAYTFTSQDAAVGKVTFKAVVTILNVRDAFPLDNEMISFPIKVT